MEIIVVQHITTESDWCCHLQNLSEVAHQTFFMGSFSISLHTVSEWNSVMLNLTKWEKCQNPTDYRIPPPRIGISPGSWIWCYTPHPHPPIPKTWQTNQSYISLDHWSLHQRIESLDDGKVIGIEFNSDRRTYNRRKIKSASLVALTGNSQVKWNLSVSNRSVRSICSLKQL